MKSIRNIATLLLFLLMLLNICSCEKNYNVDKTESDSESETEAETDSENVIVIDTIEIPNEISFMACGDNIIYYGNVRDAKQEDGSYDFYKCYSDVAEIIRNTDIAFINQETLMCGEGYDLSYYPTFNSPQEVGETLVGLGYDVINIATNHMLDKGGKGLNATIDFWNTQDTLTIGGYKNQDDFNNIRILEKGGIKIAFLAFTEHTNWLTLGSEYELVIPYFEEETIKSQVSKAKTVADMIVVSAHWGDENTFAPNDMQKHYSQLLCDLGVDVILGHHPHVLQPIEWITSSDGNHKTLCAYSLGNFMAEMDRQQHMVGGILRFNIIALNGDFLGIDDVIFTPTVFDFTTSFYNNHIYLMKDYTMDMARNHGIRAYGNKADLLEMQYIVLSTISAEFLTPEYLNTIVE